MIDEQDPERRPRLTVGALIAALGAFDPTLMVVVDAYEMGLSTPEPPVALTVDRLEFGGGMFGDFRQHDHDDNGTPISVVYLAR